MSPEFAGQKSGHSVAALSAQVTLGCTGRGGLTWTLGLWFSSEGLVLFQAHAIGAECSSSQL